MKFKERRGNVFVFDGGYDLDELELEEFHHSGLDLFRYENVLIDQSMLISLLDSSTIRDIQTAVNLMTILKDEGLV